MSCDCCLPEDLFTIGVGWKVLMVVWRAGLAAPEHYWAIQTGRWRSARFMQVELGHEELGHKRAVWPCA